MVYTSMLHVRIAGFCIYLRPMARRMAVDRQAFHVTNWLVGLSRDDFFFEKDPIYDVRAGVNLPAQANFLRPARITRIT